MIPEVPVARRDIVSTGCYRVMDYVLLRTNSQTQKSELISHSPLSYLPTLYMPYIRRDLGEYVHVVYTSTPTFINCVCKRASVEHRG